MMEMQRAYISEPEGGYVQVFLKGAGAAVPTLLNTRNNYSVARTGVGKVTISFQDDPGPTYLGCDGGGFGDSTSAANVAGWTVVAGTYTARSGNSAATFTFTIFNSSFAAADLASTSNLALSVCFKQAPPAE